MAALLKVGKGAIRSIVVTAALVLAAGCASTGARTPPPDASAPAPSSPAPTAPSVPWPAAWGDCGTATASVEYGPYTVASLAASGYVFVQGVATSFEPGVFNTTDGKPPRGFFMRPGRVPDRQDNGDIFTPVVIEVRQVLAGDVEPGTLRAFIEGGTVGCWTVNVSGPPRVTLKQRYVFILWGYHDADGKAVPGQYEVTFAWPIDANEVIQNTSAGPFTTNEGPISLAELAHLVANASPTSAP